MSRTIPAWNRRRRAFGQRGELRREKSQIYIKQQFLFLFLDEISLPVYGKDMEPVHLQVKSRKNNPEVAKKNGISEMKHCDDDLAYPIEELIEEEKEVLEDIRSGRTPVYHTAEDMFEALNRELDRER